MYTCKPGPKKGSKSLRGLRREETVLMSNIRHEVQALESLIAFINENDDFLDIPVADAVMYSETPRYRGTLPIPLTPKPENPIERPLIKEIPDTTVCKKQPEVKIRAGSVFSIRTLHGNLIDLFPPIQAPMSPIDVF